MSLNHSRFPITLFILLLVALPAWGVAPPAGAAQPLSDAQRAAKAAELARLRQRIDQMRTSLDAMRTQHDAVRNELRSTERKIGELVRSLKQVARQLDDQESKLAVLRKDQARYQNDLAVQRRLLGDQIRAAYAIGRQEYLKMLLNQQDPAALGRLLTYYDYFNRARAQRITAVRTTLHKLDQVQTAIEDETQKLQGLRAEQQRTKQALEQNYHQRATVVASLNREIRSKGQELSRLLENEQQLESLLQALNQVLADIPAEPGDYKPFPTLKGQLPWPTKGKVIDQFGKRQLGRLTWNGVVIDAPEGRPVRAVSRGRVAFADWLRGYGLLIIIDHGAGYMTLYGHNQSLDKETGDWVEPGDVIATVGNSGGQMETGLYFELRHNGRPVDPMNWCRTTRGG